MENNEVNVDDMNNTPDVTVILTRDGVIVNGNNGIMDESLFETVLKAQNYDNAVNEAREDGQIQGRNENIEATLAKSAPEQTPPTFGGGGGAPVKPQEPKKKKQFYNPFAGKMQDVEEEEK